ncbi:transposase family protein [Rhodococcus erythropolis]
MVCGLQLPAVLPYLATIVTVAAFDASGPVVVIEARTCDGTATCCPRCGVGSAWVHSRYGRRLADVALGGWPVRIELSVRRLYCENPACPR